MEPITEFVSTGVPAIDVMTPLGKGQSVMLVGDVGSRGACREVALAAIGANVGAGTRCVYAALDGGKDGAAGARALVPEAAGVVVARRREGAFANGAGKG